MKSAILGLLFATSSFATVLKSNLEASRLHCYNDNRQCSLNLNTEATDNPIHTIDQQAVKRVHEVFVDFKDPDSSISY